MLEVGIVGCGNHANRHAAVIGDAAEARIVGCADLDETHASDFAAHHDVPASYGSLEALVETEMPDALVIAAVPTAHPDLLETAMDHGVDGVLCEKPMVVPGDETRAHELRQLATATDTVVMEGLMYRHHPQLQRAIELVTTGRIGDVKYVHGQFTDYYNPDPDNWRNDAALGGGSMGAKGCYLVDAATVFAGASPVEAVCRETRDPDFEVEIGQTGTIVYENGVTAQFETNHRSVWREELKISGTEGTLVIPHAIVTTDQPREIELQLGGAYEHEPVGTESISFEPANSYALQFANFRACVRGEADPVVSFADTVTNYAIAAALIRSTDTGQVEPVDVPER